MSRPRPGGWRAEAPLRRTDGPMLAIVVVAGGIVAPVALLLGLDRISAVSGSLLLNLEAPLTIVLAVAAFAEHLDRRAVIGGVIIVSASLALSGAGEGGGATSTSTPPSCTPTVTSTTATTATPTEGCERRCG